MTFCNSASISAYIFPTLHLQPYMITDLPGPAEGTIEGNAAGTMCSFAAAALPRSRVPNRQKCYDLDAILFSEEMECLIVGRYHSLIHCLYHYLLVYIKSGFQVLAFQSFSVSFGNIYIVRTVITTYSHA